MTPLIYNAIGMLEISSIVNIFFSPGVMILYALTRKTKVLT
jgi:hypothetical protein